MRSDIEIAQAAQMQPIAQVAAKVGLGEDDISLYGKYKAKIDHRLVNKEGPEGKLILVTAISPTPAGAGFWQFVLNLLHSMDVMGLLL